MCQIQNAAALITDTLILVIVVSKIPSGFLQDLFARKLKQQRNACAKM